MSTEAKARVKASLRPAKSQVLLVAWVVAFISLSYFGTNLLSEGNNAGWGLIALASTVFLGTLWAWNKAQSDSDLDNAHPTTFHLPDGTRISTDSRTLRSPESAINISLLLQEVLSRKPLPTPDALVNEQLLPVPNTQEQAKGLVDTINKQTQAVSNYILDQLGLSDEAASNLQELPGKLPSEEDLLPPQSLNQPTDSKESNQ
jgi:hypothetical protein